LETAGDGAELLWSGVGWRGSVVVRLRTFTTASVQRGTCPACGQAGPRVLPLTPLERTYPPPPDPVGAVVEVPTPAAEFVDGEPDAASSQVD